MMMNMNKDRINPLETAQCESTHNAHRILNPFYLLKNRSLRVKREKAENKYHTAIMALNKSVFECIQKHVKEGKSYNMCPILDDYKRYMSEIKEEYARNSSYLNETPAQILDIEEGLRQCDMSNSMDDTDMISLTDGETLSNESGSRHVTDPKLSKQPKQDLNVKSDAVSLITSEISNLPTVCHNQRTDRDERRTERTSIETSNQDDVPNIYTVKCSLHYRSGKKWYEKGAGTLIINKSPSEQSQLIIYEGNKQEISLLEIIIDNNFYIQINKKSLYLEVPPNLTDDDIYHTDYLIRLNNLKTAKQLFDVIKMQSATSKNLHS